MGYLKCVRFAPINQSEFLGIIGTGDGRAIASRGYLAMGPDEMLWELKVPFTRRRKKERT